MWSSCFNPDMCIESQCLFRPVVLKGSGTALLRVFGKSMRVFWVVTMMQGHYWHLAEGRKMLDNLQGEGQPCFVSLMTFKYFTRYTYGLKK